MLPMDEKLIIYTTKDIERFIKQGYRLEEVSWKGGRFKGADLSKKNLSNADLRNADLRDANLQEAILKNADLTGADLTGANLSRANLELAKFNNAMLDRTHLNRANLTSASFENASLYNANLRNTVIEHANFTGANLREAYLDGMLGCGSAKFNKADLTDARVRYTNLDAADLRKIGAKAGSKYPDRGWNTNVFSFFKTSWTEFMPHISFNWFFRGIGMFFHLLFWPVRLIVKQMKSASKGTHS